MDDFTQPNDSPQNLANALVFCYLNSIRAHDTAERLYNEQAAARILLEAVESFIEDSPLGQALCLMLNPKDPRPYDLARRIAEDMQQLVDLLGPEEAQSAVSRAHKHAINEQAQSVN